MPKLAYSGVTRAPLKPGLLGGFESEGPTRLPRGGPGCGWLCALPGAGRDAAAPSGQALEGRAAWARRGRRGPCERHLSRDLHGEVGQRGLRVTLLSEEGHVRDC